ncbi:MAG TPA: isoaspartyl peptidase/L-asparaginase [Planctomycetaceae bacterium]|nr:isoaspartyl peptidase/L-asparaginase [Planctomycetaceae bacterium]
MKMLSLSGVIACLPLTVCSAGEPASAAHVVLGIHGGTGVSRKEMTPEVEKEIRAGLAEALRAGHAALQKPGATSLDAVETAIRVLEDNPRFNAGRGSVFTHDGRNELDASIMEGRARKAGAVAGVTVVKNPISAARAVMERTRHVLLIGKGADVFAGEAGLDIVDPSYFRTEHRWKQLQDQLRDERDAKIKKDGAGLPGSAAPREWSTVGAVAVDGAGNLAAGTSTGGMSNKRFGRVGDSPIIGAGTFADNATCAVSCTGHGEYFIRWSVAHEIASLMRYRGLSVQQAADDVIQRQLKQVDGEGAAIVLDTKGNFAMSYNSEGMNRGYITADGKITVLMYDD